jgi:hypothetical protein
MLSSPFLLPLALLVLCVQLKRLAILTDTTITLKVRTFRRSKGAVRNKHCSGDHPIR